MQLKEILAVKGSQVHTIGPEATVGDAVSKMVECNCGSLIVSDAEGTMVGIITERDILRTCAASAEPLAATVGSRMTPDPVTGSPEDEIGVATLADDHAV